MRTKVARTLISGSMLGIVLAVAACNEGSQAASPMSSLSAAPTASSAASPVTQSAPATTPHQSPAKPPAATHETKPRIVPAPRQTKSGGLPGRGELGKGADCGPVDGPNSKVDVVTDAMPAGTVGCTEAINVMSDYLRQAPTKAEGTGQFLDVDGWNCGYDGGAGGSKQIYCGKAGLSFHGKAA
ncbi:hypothetical protein [Amycolatopsis benzoatilytica]|uniref:hypothetical protein n=1 Tax=Amycolatopsis benzoatilytica TaxID=346045 RepID=UPI000369F3CA|nr:hypothetical protein [Amycolatopsis benzoatilytica]